MFSEARRMYIPAASMGEYDSYKAPAPRKKPPGTLERTDSRRTVERSDSRGLLGRQSSKGELVRSSSRSQLSRAASQSYLRNYSPVPMEEESSDSRRGSRCAGTHNTGRGCSRYRCRSCNLHYAWKLGSQ